MTRSEKIALAIEGLETMAESMRTVGNQLDILADAAKRVVAEWDRFQERVPVKTGELRR